MSTYTYSAQAVWSTFQAGCIIIRTTYNGITWDYYTSNLGTSVRYVLQAGQTLSLNGAVIYGAGQEIKLGELNTAIFDYRFKYVVDPNNVYQPSFSKTDLSGATVKLYYENETSNYVELTVGGASESFTSIFEPPTEYQLTATHDATNDMYMIQASDGTNFYDKFIRFVSISIPSGSTLKRRSPEDPSNNPPLSAGHPLDLTIKQVNGVRGWAINLNMFKDLNFSLAGQLLNLSVRNEAYDNLTYPVSITEGGASVSLVLPGTQSLVQEPNDSFAITSATTTPTSLTVTWNAPTIYDGNHNGYLLSLAYYDTVLNTLINTTETVAPNVLTKTFNGFFASTTVVVAITPSYFASGQTWYGPKSDGIYQATTSAISGPVPDAVSISSVTPSSESAVINFTAPNTNGSTIDYYFVTINNTDESVKSTKIVAATTPITLDQLIPTTNYDITVTAITSNGQGGTSTVTTFTTTSKDGDGGGGGGGGSDGVILKFVSSTSTTATLTINSTIAGDWGVTTLDGTQLGQGSIISLDTDVTITLTGLTPSTSYTVNGIVRAAGKGGGGKGDLGFSVTTTKTTTFSTQSGGGGGGGALQAGISSTYGAGTATKLAYTPLVEISLDNNDINLVDAHNYGHRVQVGIPKSSINGVFSWSRASGASAPTASCDASGLVALLDAAIASGFTDLDAIATGLSFSSTALNSAVDSRLRASGSNSANDIVMAYVLYKLYGASTYDTIDNVFNLEDAHGMLDNETLKTALYNSISTNGAAVTKMFKNLISSDPQRFFNAQGVQVAGIFETNADAQGSGNWNLTVGDVVEIRVKFTFGGAITRRDVANQQLDAGVATTNNLAAGEVFYVRFQLVVQA